MLLLIAATLYIPLTEAQRQELWLSLHPYAVVERALSEYWVALVVTAVACAMIARGARELARFPEKPHSFSSGWLLTPFLFWGLRIAVVPIRYQYSDVLYFLNAFLPALASLFLIFLLLASTALVSQTVFHSQPRCTVSQALAIVSVISAVFIDNAFYFVILYDLAR